MEPTAALEEFADFSAPVMLMERFFIEMEFAFCRRSATFHCMTIGNQGLFLRS